MAAIRVNLDGDMKLCHNETVVCYTDCNSYFTTNVTHNNNYYSDGNIISENLGCSEIFALFFGPKNIGFWTFLKNTFSELWSEGVSKIVFSEKHPGNERFITRSDSWKNFSVQLKKFAKLQYFLQKWEKNRFWGTNPGYRCTRSLGTESCCF